MFGRSSAARRELENRQLAAAAAQMEARAELDGAEASRVLRLVREEDRGESLEARAMEPQQGAGLDPREMVRQQILDELQEAEREVSRAGRHAEVAIAQAEAAKVALEAAGERRRACQLELRRVAEGRI